VIALANVKCFVVRWVMNMKFDDVALTILTGFLGSGKTSLLNAILRDPAFSDTAVLINELGDVGIDHLLVEQVGDDIILLDSGCVCCSIEDDLSAALVRLAAQRATGNIPKFRRIIVETTGIADPGPVIQTVMGRATPGLSITLDRVVTVVDAVLGPTSIDAFPETLWQIAVADILVVSKQTMADPADIVRLTERLGALAPSVPVVDHDAACRNPAMLFGPLQTQRMVPDHSAHRHHPRGHDARYASFTLRWQSPVGWTQMTAWLDGLLSVRGDDILRLKGILNIEGQERPVVVQGVQHLLFAPTRLPLWPNGSPFTEIVMISRHFSKSAAQRSLMPFVGEH
jgi:G3E family GTPase